MYIDTVKTICKTFAFNALYVIGGFFSLKFAVYQKSCNSSSTLSQIKYIVVQKSLGCDGNNR